MKYFYSLLGSLSLILGIIGVFLPVLPTTPFLLLSAALYCKGSERLYNWLMTHPRLGPYITNFRIYKAIPLRAKICSVCLMWLMISYSALFVVPLFGIKVLLFCIAIAVTIHILSFKTLK